MLSRHGVRPPTQTPAELKKLADRDWPEWPVAPGELTPHGERGERLLGSYIRVRYAEDRLWPARGCSANAAYVWADNADQRTRASGQALLEGMFPDCGFKAQ